MTYEPATFPRQRFPAGIISHAVWLYHVFSLSLRDVELILAERGIVVTHESIRHWSLKFGSDFAARLRRRRPQPGDTWHLDEAFIRIRGVVHCGARWISTAWCRTFWCRTGGTAPLPSVSSSIYCMGCSTSHGAS
jgi:putative transposase